MSSWLEEDFKIDPETPRNKIKFHNFST
jgi:hypothetical protein